MVAVVLSIGCGSDERQPSGAFNAAGQQVADSPVTYDLVPGSAEPLRNPGRGSVLQYRHPRTSMPPVVLGLAGTMELVEIEVPNFAFFYRVTSVHWGGVDSQWSLDGEGDVGYFRANSLDPTTPLQARLTLISSRGGGEMIELVASGGTNTFTPGTPPSFTGVQFLGDGYSVLLTAGPRRSNEDTP